MPECILKHEGKTELFLPRIESRGPLSLKCPSFYNPVMEYNRDINIMLFLNLGDNLAECLDGLAGTGVRGIRICNEVDGDFNFLINDRKKTSIELIKKNIDLNGLKNAACENKNLNVLLNERRFDYIDIDPFGSPIPFVDSALQSIKNNGILAVTATDTAALNGSSPKVSFRRYGVTNSKTPCIHEIGLRVLIGFLAVRAASFGFGIKPILSDAHAHYYSIYVRVMRGAKNRDETLEKTGFLLLNKGKRRVVKKQVLKNLSCPSCFRMRNEVPSAGRIQRIRQGGQLFPSHESTKARNFDRERFEEMLIKSEFPIEIKNYNNFGCSEKVIGRLWTGNLWDYEILKKFMLPEWVKNYKTLEKNLTLWLMEAKAPPFFYESHSFGKNLKTNITKLDRIIEALRENGFVATKTSLSPQGFRTDAEGSEIAEIFKDLTRFKPKSINTCIPIL